MATTQVGVLLLGWLALIAGASANAKTTPLPPPLSSATQQLLDLTMNSAPSAPAMSVDAVKALVAAGADIQAKNIGGSSPFVLATETYSYYAEAGDARAAGAKAVAEYLMSLGADISLVDGRGFSPLYYLITYEPTFALASEILAQKPNFAAPNPHGKNPLHALANRGGAAFFPFFEAVLTHLSDFHGSVDTVDEDGISPVLVAASTQGKDGNGVLILQRYLESVPEPRRSILADLPDHSGMSPLMAAIQRNHPLVIDYLLANYPVDVNRVNTDDETPVSLAMAAGNTALVARLEAMGAQPPAPASDLSCDRANTGPFGFKELLELVFNQCAGRIRSVDDLLPLLPHSLRSHYSLMYATQGLAQATPASPRAILYGKDGKLVISFGDRHFDDPIEPSLEFYAFDDTKKQFNFYELDFPRHSRPLLSPPNPAKCVSCHGLPARPIWNSWTLWPGAYFGEMSALYPGAGERKDYEDFIARAASDPSSRYQTLLPTGTSAVESEFGHYMSSFTSFWITRNLSLDFLFSSLMGQRIAAEMATQSALQPMKYAILAALSCQDPVENYLTPSAQAALPRTEAEILDEMNALAGEEAQSRLGHQDTVRPGSPVGRYNYQVSRPDLYPYAPPTRGFNGDIPRITRLRYLIEGTLGDGAIAGWFTPFNDNRPNYGAIDLSDIEARAWKTLLDPVTDADLIALYSSVESKVTISQVTLWIYDLALPVQADLCPLLKQKSLATRQR